MPWSTELKVIPDVTREDKNIIMLHNVEFSSIKFNFYTILSIGARYLPMKSISLLCLFCLFLPSCVNKNSIKKVPPPVESFVKVVKKIKITKCKEVPNNKCETGTYYSTGSGVIIGHTQKNTIMLTAAHVCQTLVSDNVLSGIEEIETELLVVDFKNRTFKSVVILSTKPPLEKVDICMIASPKIPAKAVKIGPKPSVGDKVYNISAPMGITHLPAVPILTGIYSGSAPGVNSDLYTVPAVGGSSGSAIFDEDYRLIGILVASVRNFHHISLSVRYEDLTKFIEEGKATILKMDQDSQTNSK